MKNWQREVKRKTCGSSLGDKNEGETGTGAKEYTKGDSTGVHQGYHTFGEGRRRRKGEEEEDGDDKR